MAEKSLACDDLAPDPAPLFRIVTVRDCNSDLRVLRLPRSHDGRTQNKLESLRAVLKGTVGTVVTLLLCGRQCVRRHSDRVKLSRCKAALASLEPAESVEEA